MTSEEPTKPSDEAVEPTSSKKTTSKKCEMCNQNEFKYKCPRCFMLTCSLACCRQHKTERNCSGERDKTKFVDKEEFDEQLLLSDYRFLEEQSRLVDNFQRTLEQVSKPVESTGLKPFHSAVYDQLRKFVYHKFGIRMQLMPAQSTRHLYNRTRFNRQQGLVSWSIEFVFYLHASSSKYFRFNSKNFIFSSKSTLNQVLNNFYNKFKSDLFNSSNRELDQKFCHIFETGDFKNDMSILYEIVDLKARQRYFVALNLDKSLEENLLNKTIIEYPSLFIVRNQDLADFDIREYNQINDPITEMVEEEEKDEDGTDEDDEDGEGKLIHPEVEENGTSRKFKRAHGQDEEASKKFKSLDTIETKPRVENEELEDGEI